MIAPPPGEVARAWIDRLALSESPAFTARRARREEATGAPQDPIVWTRARGSNVEDVDGNRYVDLTSGFGACAVGHAHPKVVAAIQSQSETLIHALGDFHPSDIKIQLLERLCSLAPWDARAILSSNGSDAVESALKTAAIATGRPGVLAFEGGYHGLSLGALAACGYSESFRSPFAQQLNPHVRWAAWPDIGDARSKMDSTIGAILVEPIQGRGGIRVPPPEFLQELAQLAHQHGALLIVDEILTGLGRCGVRWVSAGHADILCAGKALGGGLPVSACIAKAEVMSAWGDPSGEAIHTGTFYGHPLGCAAALAALDLLDELQEQAKTLGEQFATRLSESGFRVEGQGMMLGVRFDHSVLPLVHELLRHGYLTLPAGRDATTLELLPALTIEPSLLDAFVTTLQELA